MIISFRNIIYRADIFNSKVFIDFFELDKHFDKIKQFSPEVKYQINKLKHEVSDMIYLDEFTNSTCIMTVLSNKNVSLELLKDESDNSSCFPCAIPLLKSVKCANS